MGYDLRMPAAFRALQRTRPPENVKSPKDVHVSLPSLVVVGDSSTETANAGSEPMHQVDTGFNEARIHFEDEDISFVEDSPYASSKLKTHITNENPRDQELEYGSPKILANSSATGFGRIPLIRESSEVSVAQHISIGEDSFEDSSKPKSTASAPELMPSRDSLDETNKVSTSISDQLSRRNLYSRVDGHEDNLISLASTASFRSGVDRYGFKKPTLNISEAEFNAWSNEYDKYMLHRKEKWYALLSGHGLNVESQGGTPVRFPPESQKLRRYVRKGIPPQWRGNAWFWFARGYDKLNSHPGLYKRYVEDTLSLRNSDTEHIERDLHRTFPDNIHFRNDPVTNEESQLLKSLRRVLRAFSAYQPKIGYCQSLNFIAGNLLLFMEEEKAFWMLVIITQNYLTGLHEVNLEQVNISQGILMISVRDRLPKIWSALNLEQSFEDNFISNLPPISLCTAPWFMSLMVNVLPTETMLRVWDCFFLEGPKTLYRISLTIFKLAESKMGAATDELEIFQIIQSAPRTIYDPELLMKACFKRTNGFGHVSNDDIALLRAFVQNRRKQALEGVEQPLSDRHAYAKLYRGRRVRAKLSLYR